eukprot:gene3173-14713_t
MRQTKVNGGSVWIDCTSGCPGRGCRQGTGSRSLAAEKERGVAMVDAPLSAH